MALEFHKSACRAQRRMALALVAAAGVAVAPSTAGAASRSVVLLAVRGQGGDHLADLISHALGDLYDVVDSELYQSAAQRLGKPAFTTEDVRGVASSMRIDAVIDAEVRSVGGRQQLVTVVREGRTGSLLGRSDYDLPRGGALPDIVDAAVCDLVFALSFVDPISEPMDEP